MADVIVRQPKLVHREVYQPFDGYLIARSAASAWSFSRRLIYKYVSENLGDHNNMDNSSKIRTDYTQGSIFGSIIKMGLPSMIGFLAHHIYHLVDTWWVSRLPEKEAGVAAVTFLGNVIWFFFSFNQLIGPGSVAIISRRYGEKAYDLTEKAIKESFVLKLLIGGVLGVVAYFFVDDMLVLLGAEGQALLMGVQYGQIMFLGMAAMYATYSVFTAMRGVANPQMALILMLSSNVLNMVLDPILMFGYLGLPAMGIRGAALATVISYALAFLTGLLLFYGNITNVQLHIRGRESVSLPSMWRMLKIGIPAWIGDMSFSGARMLITRLVAPFGTAIVAAYGVGTQVTAIGISVLIGIGLGLSALIGHNLGGEKYERAQKIGDQAILIGIVIMLFLGLISFTQSSNIIGLFFNNPETTAQGAIMLKIFAMGFPFIGVLIMLEQIHLGVGLNTPAMTINILHSWLLEVVPIYLLTIHLGFDQYAVWWAISGAGLVTSTLFYLYYRRGRWLTYQV